MNFPLPPHEADRLRVLRGYQILDTRAEPAFDRLAQLAARWLHAPIGLVNLLDADRQWSKARWGTDLESLPRELSFCAHTIAQPEPFVLPDIAQDPRFRDHPLVVGSPGLRFYAGAALVSPGGYPLGTICVLDYQPRRALNGEEAQTLRDLSFLVVDELRLRLTLRESRRQFSRRLRAERAGRRAEERLSRVVANVPGVVYQARHFPDDRIELISVSAVSQTLLGLSPAELCADVGRFYQLVHPEDRPGLETRLRRRPGGRPALWEWEGRVIVDGEVRWVRISSRPRPGTGRGPVCWDGLLLDVTADKTVATTLHQAMAALEARVAERTRSLTAANAALQSEIAERQRAEQTLRQTHDLTRAVIEGSSDAIFVKDLTGKYLLMNRAGGQMFGRPAESIVGEDNSALFDAASCRQIAGFDRLVLGRSLPLTYEIKTTTVAGVTRSYQTTKSPLFDDQGEVTGLIGISRDVTLAKELERRLRTHAVLQETIAQLSRSALSGLGLPDLFTETCRRLLYVLNVGLGVIFEHRPAQARFVVRAACGPSADLLGQSFSDDPGSSGPGHTVSVQVPVIVPDLARETRFRTQADGREDQLVSALLVPVGGERRHFGVLAVYTQSPREFTPDEVTFLLAIANLLAVAIDRKQAEADLQHARLEAEQANQAKGELVSRVSHELRTPLNAIIGFGQLLEMEAGPDRPRERESVEHILGAGRHLLELVNEVLDLTQVEAGRLELALAPVAIDPVLEEVVSLVRPLAHKLAVRLESPPSASGRPGYVLADERRLRQILLNLLSNAVKYNRPGGQVAVACRLAQPGHPPHRLRIAVADTGVGIAPADLKRLFTPFERLGATRSRVEGSGLGLALSRRLVEAQGGRIGVESTPGAGSTFWVELPVADLVAAGMPPPPPGRP